MKNRDPTPVEIFMGSGIESSPVNIKKKEYNEYFDNYSFDSYGFMDLSSPTSLIYSPNVISKSLSILLDVSLDLNTLRNLIYINYSANNAPLKSSTSSSPLVLINNSNNYNLSAQACLIDAALSLFKIKLEASSSSTEVVKSVSNSENSNLFSLVSSTPFLFSTNVSHASLFRFIIHNTKSNLKTFSTICFIYFIFCVIINSCYRFKSYFQD
jgi:hypothetical protein